MAQRRSGSASGFACMRRGSISCATALDANKRAMALFGFSILYLFSLFGLLVVEHGFGLLARWGL